MARFVRQSRINGRVFSQDTAEICVEFFRSYYRGLFGFKVEHLLHRESEILHVHLANLQEENVFWS